MPRLPYANNPHDPVGVVGVETIEAMRQAGVSAISIRVVIQRLTGKGWTYEQAQSAIHRAIANKDVLLDHHWFLTLPVELECGCRCSDA